MRTETSRFETSAVTEMEQQQDILFEMSVATKTMAEMLPEAHLGAKMVAIQEIEAGLKSVTDLMAIESQTANPQEQVDKQNQAAVIIDAIGILTTAAMKWTRMSKDEKASAIVEVGARLEVLAMVVDGEEGKTPRIKLYHGADDLLAALKGILKCVNVRIDDPRIAVFDAARAAVANAE